MSTVQTGNSARAGVPPACPSCERGTPSVFYEVRGVPVHSVLLFGSADAAVGYPRGDIALGLCERCGFVTNVAFDPTVHEYSAGYEETQGFSETFNAFARRLALELVGRFGVRGRTVLEIGCGKGDFLHLLCEAGGNRGVGFDPAYVPDRDRTARDRRVSFVRDFFTEKHLGHGADVVCCRMTLEHIRDTGAFLRLVRRACGDRRDALVFFQVPDAARILKEGAFWDVYYEHCSYFTADSLARLFALSGFEVQETWRDYGDQYLMLAARPGRGAPLEPRADPGRLVAAAERFRLLAPRARDAWRSTLLGWRQGGRRAVLWGGGSKGVAFLTTVGVTREIEYVVDVNPFKQGHYMAGTGHPVVAPEFLRDYRPDTVVVMNPIYESEIRGKLAALGIEAGVLVV